LYKITLLNHKRKKPVKTKTHITGNRLSKVKSIFIMFCNEGVAAPEAKQIDRKSRLPTDKFSLFETALVGRGNKIYIL
jgi:hypothetical protein